MSDGSSSPEAGTPASLGTVIDALLSGEIDREQAFDRLRTLGDPLQNLGYARIDHDRARRRGFPEVIFGLGKRPEQIAEIFDRLAERNPNVLATRASPAAAQLVRSRWEQASYDEGSQVLSLHRERTIQGRGTVLVVSAGTSDQNVAHEARLSAEVMGNEVEFLADVGVAGLHRVLAVREQLEAARVVICVAGLEAALPSVVAGLVHRPVIAVPTSVGYGATFGGVTALLASLTACSGGVTTVNIDNGFGAAYAATLMNRD